MAIKPFGPWVLVRPDPPETQYKGVIYMPQGNVEERLSMASGVVEAVGQGDFNPKRREPKFIPLDIEPGQRIVFRGHIQEANRVDRESCLIHVKDIVGEVVDGKLSATRVHG